MTLLPLHLVVNGPVFTILYLLFYYRDITSNVGGPKCDTVPNFVQIGQTIVEIWPFSIFQDGGRPPSWICCMPVWTTHKVYFGGLCHCVKFGLNWCRSFDNMQVLIF